MGDKPRISPVVLAVGETIANNLANDPHFYDPPGGPIETVGKPSPAGIAVADQQDELDWRARQKLVTRGRRRGPDSDSG